MTEKIDRGVNLRNVDQDARSHPGNVTPVDDRAGFEVDASIRDKSLSDILVEVATLRAQVPELQKRAELSEDSLTKMKAAMEKMGKTPAPAVGVAKVVSMTKREDAGGTGDDDAMDILAKRIVTLQKIAPEGDAAAATLIKAVHSQGGRPFAAFEG